MRNYVIQNGKDSRYIKGLLIQELPPITKPLMRTSIEQIDGRDGDVITKLGENPLNRFILEIKDKIMRGPETERSR